MLEIQKKVAIIVTTYNQDVLLEACLSSVKNKTDYRNYRVYFVDDSGKGEIGKKITTKFPWVKTTVNKKNLGFSKANNVGIRRALREYNPDYVLLLNDDTEVVQRDWLNRLVEVGESNPRVGILGCKIVYADRRLQNIGGYIRKWEIVRELKDRNDIFEVDHVMGAFLLIKKVVIEKIGILDEVFTPYLLEDTDYCLEAKEKGFLIKSVGSVEIIHKKGKTIDSIKSKKQMFVRFKNDMIFSMRRLKLNYALFRIFVYLPLVAVMKKRTDEDDLKIKNFKLRENFLMNMGLYLVSLVYAPVISFLRK